MFGFILKRILESIPVLWIIATITFFMLQMAPGGPFDNERTLPIEIEANIKAYYGLDKPLKNQYFEYLFRLLKGDLGPSYKYPGWTVKEIILSKLPVSAELGFYSIVTALLIGISFGLIASNKYNSFLDKFVMGFSMIGICLPNFVLGPLFILLFAINLGWTQSSGWLLPSDKILPTITMALFYIAYIARLTRSSMIDVLRQDYIRTARSKGISEFHIHLIHGLRNGINPVISFLGPALAGIISGSFVIESVFNIPGLGKFFIQAAFNRDYTLVLGTVLCFSVFIVIFNLIADILLVWTNPRQQFK